MPGVDATVQFSVSCPINGARGCPVYEHGQCSQQKLLEEKRVQVVFVPFTSISVLKEDEILHTIEGRIDDQINDSPQVVGLCENADEVNQVFGVVREPAELWLSDPTILSYQERK